MTQFPSLSPVEWIGLGLVLVGVPLAFWTGPDLTVALPAAGMAVVGAVLLIGAGLVERVKRPKLRIDVPVSSGLLTLRGAWSSGVLGRKEILATLRGLHRELRGTEIGVRTLEEETRLLNASPKRFREWVAAEVALLEEET